jgi:hypothetical protein
MENANPLAPQMLRRLRVDLDNVPLRLRDNMDLYAGAADFLGESPFIEENRTETDFFSSRQGFEQGGNLSFCSCPKVA